MEELQSTLPISFDLPYQIKHVPAKRAFDIAFSLLVLILGLPILVIIALAIRLTSKGKIIYAHQRIGRGGVSFKCYKFRTMHKDADARLKALLENNPHLREEWEQKRKLAKDPRVTLIGNFLRKTSLDELPQFWNVLKGDLSVVGPRPVVATEILKYYGPKGHKILSVRPGLTCLWQVSGRNDTSYATRVLLDEIYVDTQCMSLDLKLIAKTIPAMVFPRGAY